MQGDQMFKALFVDDEIIVREGVERRVDWESHGFILSGTFSHGLQVKEYLQVHDDVSLVFSDISMPVMDGLELAKYIHDCHPHIYVLLLTGYDEFEYAQEAIKYNVKEFLLKPITANEMGTVLSRVHEVLLGEQHKIMEQQELMDKLRESLPLLRERFLNRLVTGRIPAERLPEQLSSYQLPEMRRNSLCIIIDTYRRNRPEENGSSPDLYLLSVFDLCRQHLNEEDTLFFNKDDQPVCIIQQDSAKDLQRRSLLLCEQLRQQINQHYGESASFGIGRSCSDFSHLHRSYRDAEKALRHQYVLGSNRIISAEQIHDNSDSLHEIRRDLEEELIHSLKTEPPEISREIVKRFFTEPTADQATLQYAQIQTYLLLGSLISFIEEAGIYTSEFLPTAHEGFTMISSLKSKEEVQQWFCQFIDTIHRHISRQSMDQGKQKIQQAVEYLEQHFSNPALGIQDICTELHISASHFSALFKRVTGKTFVEYLTALRVQQASMLLKTTNLCAYEVAEDVGYEDSHYFSQVFKKVTGMSIREYRGKLSESQEELR